MRTHTRSRQDRTSRIAAGGWLLHLQDEVRRSLPDPPDAHASVDPVPPPPPALAMLLSKASPDGGSCRASAPPVPCGTSHCPPATLAS
ncbi:hypothetical protein P7K49_009012, partial [Saguinus oedipus]